MLASCQWIPKSDDTAEDSVAVSDSTASTDSTAQILAPTIQDDSTRLAQQVILDSLSRQLAAIQASISTLSALPQDSSSTADTDSSSAARGPGEIQDQLGDAVGGFQNLWWRIISSVLLLIVFYFLIKGIVWLLDTLSERSATRRLFFKKLVPIVRIVMWTVAGYLIFVYIFDVTQGGLVSAFTAVGVAVGFASQDVLKNIFGGLIIIADQPFQVGDKINIGGTYGEVVSIGLRSTRLVTPDDNLVSVPNAQVVESQVANANAGALDCQVVVDLYLPGWVDVIKAKSIAYSAAANSKYVYLDKPIVVNVKDVFKETFLTHFVVKAYVLDARYEFAFASDVTETAKVEFQREGFLPSIVHIPPFRTIDGANGKSHSDVEES